VGVGVLIWRSRLNRTASLYSDAPELIAHEHFKGHRPQWHLLKPKPWPVYGKSLAHQELDFDRMTGGSFRECLDGCAACGLLRKNFPQSS
jgi:hypothetical protein